MVDVTRQLPLNQARKLVAEILLGGVVTPSGHAQREMLIDRHGPFAMTDVLNVLRHGKMQEPGELVNGTWRYRLHTARFCVVVAFRSETELVVVTNWRKRP
jgi:malate synthase